MTTLKDAIQDNGDQEKEITYVKVDIESSEIIKVQEMAYFRLFWSKKISNYFMSFIFPHLNIFRISLLGSNESVTDAATL